VTLTSAVELASVTFVEFGGRSGHEGWLPLEGDAIVGQDDVTALLMEFTQPVTQATAQLIDVDEHVLEEKRLSEVDETPSIVSDYLAHVRIPSSTFKLRVVGTDSLGRPFARIWPHEYHPSGIRLQFKGESRPDPADRSVTMPLQLANYSSSQEFGIAISTLAPGVTLSPSHIQVEVPERESRSIDIKVFLPEAASSYSRFDIIATAQSTSAPSLKNEARTTVEVAP